jgi:hypothetical protein
MDRIYSALIPEASSSTRSTIAETLAKFGDGILRFAAESGTTIRPLASNGELYRDASPALKRLGIDVDAWPAPPAGLFVVEERTVYLRSLSPMTVAHEFGGHALDCALGGGVYLSGIDPDIRRCYSNATSFVTPYAATALDEYFAECVGRAYLGINDPASPWPKATRERLLRIDPAMFAIVEEIFARFAPAVGEQIAMAFGGCP